MVEEPIEGGALCAPPYKLFVNIPQNMFALLKRFHNISSGFSMKK